MEAATRLAPRQQYIRDKRTGEIHGYLECLKDRLGKDFEFCDPPVVDPLLQAYRSKSFATTQEVREAGFLLSIDIPSQLPLSKAVEHYNARVNLLFSMGQLPEQTSLKVQVLDPEEAKKLAAAAAAEAEKVALEKAAAAEAARKSTSKT